MERLTAGILIALGTGCSALSAGAPSKGNTAVTQAPAMTITAVPAAPVEFTFIKGDSHDGSRVNVFIEGDSLHYNVTTFSPDAPPVHSLRSVRLNPHRRISLKNVLGELPRYPSFGTCYGKGMKYYLVETPEGKFYRSLPEDVGRCYTDEPGIWSLFQDLDDLMVPPSETDYQELSSAS
jgi:hypothetical protein